MAFIPTAMCLKSHVTFDRRKVSAEVVVSSISVCIRSNPSMFSPYDKLSEKKSVQRSNFSLIMGVVGVGGRSARFSEKLFYGHFGSSR